MTRSKLKLNRQHGNVGTPFWAQPTGCVAVQNRNELPQTIENTGRAVARQGFRLRLGIAICATEIAQKGSYGLTSQQSKSISNHPHRNLQGGGALRGGNWRKREMGISGSTSHLPPLSRREKSQPRKSPFGKSNQAIGNLKPIELMPMETSQAIDRFWSKVKRQGNKECWLWLAGKGAGGYGCFSFQGRSIGAHQFSWKINHGEIPPGKAVLHKCDVRLCVNPHHLFLGTARDNVHDMLNKRRNARGEKQGSAKLTTEQVLEIRRDYVRGITSQRSFAEKFGVSTRMVSYVVAGRWWKHLTNKSKDKNERHQ